MTDDKKPEKLSDEELAKAKGGYSVWIGGSVKKAPEGENITLDNGLKRSGVFEPNDKN